MLTLSNALSFSRVPLAFLFLQDNALLRVLAVVLAMITDSVDGYLARRSKSSSRLGVILDPVTDKFFVYFSLITLFSEGTMSAWAALSLLARDMAVCIYATTMWIKGQWRSMVLNSFLFGKVATSLQFIILIGILLKVTFPWTVYALSGLLGLGALIELYRRSFKIIN